MNELTPEEKRVIIDKGTEAPFTGEYYKNAENLQEHPPLRELNINEIYSGKII